MAGPELARGRGLRAVLVAVAAALAAGVLGGCGGVARGPAQLSPATVLDEVGPKALVPVSSAPVPGGPGHLTAWVRDRRVLLRSQPGGRVVARLGRRTEFGSHRVLAVSERRGRWLGVIAPEAGNGRLGWLVASRVRLYRVRYTMHVSLSRRALVVRRDGHAVLRFAVAVGAPATPTPRGTFAVTDKLRTQGGGTYGCCILALSAHQPRLHEGWQGGDRVAIHGTPAPASVGQAVSNGCLRAREADIRRALKIVPLGTRVTVGA